MKNIFKQIRPLMILFGFDPWKTVRTIRELPHFIGDFLSLKRQFKGSQAIFPLAKLYPCLSDRYAHSGTASGHYFHQDFLVARKIFKNKPKLHVDIGSRVDGFVAHVASFRTVEVFDIREQPSNLPNIKFIRADLMDLDSSLISYCDSLSCLHTIEHLGLGRYGDRISHDGYILGLDNIYKIIKDSGKFYFSVPIGPQRIEFNAHRIFSLNYLLTLLTGKYEIESFSYVDDQGALFEDVKLEENKVNENFGCQNGCGIFELTKICLLVGMIT